MTNSPVTYNPETNAVVLQGAGGRSILLAYLLKAKFGDAYDHEMLFHPDLAKLLTNLSADRPKAEGPAPFTPDALWTMAVALVDRSAQLNWWNLSREGQIAFVQDVVAAPHRLSAEQLEILFENIDMTLWHRRQVVEAAQAANSARTPQPSKSSE